MSAHRTLVFLDAGEAGLVAELGQGIDSETNAAVMALAASIAEIGLDGIIEIIPTYRSLLVQFDPLRMSKSALADAVHRAWQGTRIGEHKGKLWHLPVRYGGEHGVDLAFVAHQHGLDEAEVISRHAAATYRVYTIGFAPGFAYLGGLDETLHTSRRMEPRLRTPPRSVSIGGMQSAVSPPLEIPSGWHMLGQTAVKTYDPGRVGQPFLLAAGDFVRFHPVAAATYERQLEAAEAGELIADCEEFRD